MLHEDLRYIHEDVERLEQAIADRVLEDPKHIRTRLTRDHEIASFLSRIQSQSENALRIYNGQQEARMREIQSISTGDPFDEFYKQLGGIRDFHKRYPNEAVENLERAYKKQDDGSTHGGLDIDGMFTGEEAFGRFFDLTMLHEDYLNLPGVKGVRKLTYLQYLDNFDKFTPPQCTVSRQDKMSEQYFGYLSSLAEYLERFIRRTKPLEDLDRLFHTFGQEFEKLWELDKVPGWEAKRQQHTSGSSNGPVTEGKGEGIWCATCSKEFKNDNVYQAHLKGKKHIKNAESGQAITGGSFSVTNGHNVDETIDVHRLKEKAVAEREHRIRKVAAAMQIERDDTRVNVERKSGMTDKERQQEIAALYAADEDRQANGSKADEGGETEGGEKIYNPLKLPLAWDGKPIPFWLYKLHGLGVEFPCEICGNYVYMGRRAFDKHFSEARHVYGLKCLGITQTGLFREITNIAEAERLWEKVNRERAGAKERGEGVVEMEDGEGNVMPERVWEDLRREGLL